MIEPGHGISWRHGGRRRGGRSGGGDIEEDKDGDIAEPSHRLLRGPCTLSNPTLVTGIELQQTGQAA